MDTGSREFVVERARQVWISRLIDTSRRNNLLYFRDLKTGTVDLGDCDVLSINRLLEGDEVSARDLWPGRDVTANVAKLREIARRALANEEEKGLQTLFLAVGMASWRSTDDGRPPESALLLLPIAIKGKVTEGRHLTLVRTGDPQVNLALIHALKTEHGCEIDVDGLAAQLLSGRSSLSPKNAPLCKSCSIACEKSVCLI